jgi:hypothetical protein
MIMGKERNERDTFVCPVCRFFQDLEKGSGKKSKFFEHLTQSHVEFLKAIKILVDEKIGALEKRKSPKGKKKMSKIKVE